MYSGRKSSEVGSSTLVEVQLALEALLEVGQVLAVGADGAAGHGAQPAVDHDQLAVAVHVPRAAVPRAPLPQARVGEHVRAAEAVAARGQSHRGVEPLVAVHVYLLMESTLPL